MTVGVHYDADSYIFLVLTYHASVTSQAESGAL